MPRFPSSRALALWPTLLILFSSLAAQAEPVTLLVSDIDDTLKVAAGGSPLFSAARVIADEAFPGMAEVYRALATANPAMRIDYVSRAPREVLLGRHTEFLLANDFPQGAIHLAPFGDRDTFKVREISGILSALRPGLVVLVGDNKERDNEVYRQIRTLFVPKGFRFLTYLHTVKPEVPSAYVRTPTTKALRYHDATELAADLRAMNAL